MKHIWTVFCRNVLEDKNSGNLSLVDIVERMTFGADLPDERPYMVPIPTPHFIVSSWLKPDDTDQAKCYTRIRFMSPDGTALVNYVLMLEFENSPKLRVSGQVESLPYTVNGTYEFEVSYGSEGDWKVAARVPLEMVLSRPELDEEVIESPK